MKKNHSLEYLYFYFIIGCLIITLILWIILAIRDFREGPIPNYLKYNFKKTKVAEIYQKEYVPEIEEYIQTSDLPDVTINVDRCFYTEYDKLDELPVYQLDFTYSSHTVDDYYKSAINSKRGAKDLFYMILEVNLKKNHHENEYKTYWYGKPFESEGSRILFQEDDRFVMVLSGDKHEYMIENQKYVDRLTIDDKVVYELKKPGPSKYTYTPSKHKKEYKTYESSESSTYNDGYNSAIDDGDYDHDRYRNDPSYRQGVDDGFDEVDEDY